MAARRGKSQAKRNSSNGTPGWVWLVAGAAIAAVVFLAAPGLFKKDGDGFLRVGPHPNPDAQPAPVADADVDTPAELPRPAGKPADKGDAAAPTQYDFYTLLPGKEVQMSDAELAASARAEEAARARAALEGKPVPPAPASVVATGVNASPPAPVSEAPVPKPIAEAAPVRTPTSAPPVASTVATAATVAPRATAATPATADNVRYILQAGSFGASGDAESTKAKLAMLGLSARVESAQIGGRTVYRVRMGPYGTASELAEAKQKLSGSGLPAIAIKAQ
ncbi:MAG TPA: SPOR domain-containing protein [Stenotrophomonas sp.]